MTADERSRDGESLGSRGAVQLGQVEVDPQLLTRDVGGNLWDLAGTDWVPVRASISQAQVMQQVPSGGWRELVTPHAPTDDQVFAAPHPTVADGWLLATFFKDDSGRRQLDVSFTAQYVRPGRAVRRANLELAWPIPLSARAGKKVLLTVGLTNRAEHDWLNVGGDSGLVRAWLRDKDGRPLPAPRVFMFSYCEPLPTLRAGQTLELEAPFVTTNPDQLPPGDYGVTATLIDLNLTSSISQLTLTRG